MFLDVNTWDPPQKFGFDYAYNHWPEKNLNEKTPPVSLWMSFCSWNLSHPSGSPWSITNIIEYIIEGYTMLRKMYRWCCSMLNHVGGLFGSPGSVPDYHENCL